MPYQTIRRLAIWRWLRVKKQWRHCGVTTGPTAQTMLAEFRAQFPKDTFIVSSSPPKDPPARVKQRQAA